MPRYATLRGPQNDLQKVGVFSDADMKAFLNPKWTLVGSVSAPWGTGWQALAGAGPPPGFFLDPWGFVHIRGAVKRVSGVGTTIFTLPAGYRPLYTESPTVSGDGAFAMLDIQPSGIVRLALGTAASWLNIYVSFAIF